MIQWNLRLPRELHAALARRAQLERLSMQELGRRLFASAVSQPLPGDPVDELTELRELVELLERRLSRIEEMIERGA